MPKPANLGAINIKAPSEKKPEARKKYLKLKQLAEDEFEKNRKLKIKPTGFPQLLMEMLELRYASDLLEEQEDAKRIKDEAKQAGEAPGKDLF